MIDLQICQINNDDCNIKITYGFNNNNYKIIIEVDQKNYTNINNEIQILGHYYNQLFNDTKIEIMIFKNNKKSIKYPIYLINDEASKLMNLQDKLNPYMMYLDNRMNINKSNNIILKTY